MDIDYIDSGVWNIAATSRSVICPVVRSPVNTTEIDVDGCNAANTSTTCTVWVFNYNGDFQAAQTFTESGGASGRSWDHKVGFAQGLLTTYSYVSTLCALPASRQGIIYGATAIHL